MIKIQTSIEIYKVETTERDLINIKEKTNFIS